MSVIKTESITKIYKQGQDEVHAVDNVSLSIDLANLQPLPVNPVPARPRS